MRIVRTERFLLRRDPSRDRQDQQIHFEGYQVLWPDGQPVAVGIEAFCTIGQRLLGLGRYLAGRPQVVVEMLCFPLPDREANLTRVPGTRLRRLCLRRTGSQGQIGRAHV